jgi:hypothetical protein
LRALLFRYSSLTALLLYSEPSVLLEPPVQKRAGQRDHREPGLKQRLVLDRLDLDLDQFEYRGSNQGWRKGRNARPWRTDADSIPDAGAGAAHSDFPSGIAQTTPGPPREKRAAGLCRLKTRRAAA